MKLKINGITIECETVEIGITNWDNIFYSHWVSLSVLGEKDVMLYANLTDDESNRIEEQIEAQNELSNKPDLGCTFTGDLDYE